MRARLLPLVLIPLLGACTTTVVERAADGPVPPASGEAAPPPSSTPAVAGASELSSVAPVLSVERFLQAVNAEDIESMGRLFGTAKGPATGDRLQLQTELALISRILRHQDYRVVSDRRAFGREAQTHRIGVNLTIDGEVIPDVAFLVVQADGGRWFVECVDLEKVTSGTGQGCQV
jgi:hypothetical protein